MKLSIIPPTFNEAVSIKETISRLRKSMVKRKFRFLFRVGGSIDPTTGSSPVAKQTENLENELLVINHRRSEGKRL